MAGCSTFVRKVKRSRVVTSNGEIRGEMKILLIQFTCIRLKKRASNSRVIMKTANKLTQIICQSKTWKTGKTCYVNFKTVRNRHWYELYQSCINC